MPGGTWTLENKIRPGAYVNFSAAPYWNDTISGSGVVALPLEMSWCGEHTITEVYATDLLNGNAKTLLGYDSEAEEILPITEALKNCRKLLVYRVNGSGFKATATLGALTITAKYPGKRGNDIGIGVFALEEGFSVVTYVDDVVVDKQTLGDEETPLENDWVTFVLSDRLTATVVTKLSNGSDGMATIEDYKTYFGRMKNKDWQVMALPKDDDTLAEKFTTFIKEMRENCGKKVQGVVCNYAADYEGMINVTQGYKKGSKIVSVTDFTAWAAGVSAGAAVNESNTYKTLPNADAIIDEIAVDAIEEELAKGIFLLSRRTDGTVVVEQDINSLTTFGEHKNSFFSKNRIIRCLDKIANAVANIFEVNYIGTISNNAEGRDLFKQDIISMMEDLSAIGAIENFDGADDILIAEGKNPDSVVVSLAVCPVDAMEKLYITVEVA